MTKLYFLWDGQHGTAVDNETYRDELITRGFIEVDGFEVDRVLPTADEVLAYRQSYATKDMGAKKPGRRARAEAGVDPDQSAA